jgi:hypothetical protein
MFDMSPIIELCAEPLVVRRYAPGRWVNGVYKKETSPEETINTTGAVQPAKSEDIQMLPEGYRTQELAAVFLEVELQLGRAEGSTVIEEPDLVEVGGKSYEPIREVNWSRVGNFRKYILVRASQ